MGKSFRLIIAVVVTCVVAAGGLAVTYLATKDRIAEQVRLAEENSLKTVLPDAAEFVDAGSGVLEAAQTAADDVDCSAVYRAVSADGSLVGWGLRVAGRGYGGPIELVLGLDSTGKVTGVTILTMSETPGLGTKVQSEEWFLEQFKQLPEGFDSADMKELDTISGSTKSSRGVRNGVEAGGRIYTDVLSDLAGGE
ncbi:MAG: FMN-binding protein [Coriobacteriia bacterium]|nr:FMN-binding protein [Coriobacteriia bacterium]MBN2823500.1 FMN-binding protein [Coriobacteriia bacterium]